MAVRSVSSDYYLTKSNEDLTSKKAWLPTWFWRKKEEQKDVEYGGFQPYHFPCIEKATSALKKVLNAMQLSDPRLADLRKYTLFSGLGGLIAAVSGTNTFNALALIATLRLMATGTLDKDARALIIGILAAAACVAYEEYPQDLLSQVVAVICSTTAGFMTASFQVMVN